MTSRTLNAGAVFVLLTSGHSSTGTGDEMLEPGSHEAHICTVAFQEAAWTWHRTPAEIYRPSLSIDGNQWCALYGENLQDGVAGFGDSPALAMDDFNAQWQKSLPHKGNG